MAPRLRIQQRQLLSQPIYICHQCRLASLAAAPTATTPAPPIHQSTTAAPPIARYPRTQPPSHKPPEFRKSQLHRQYQSLLRSCPLTLIFQHNNLKATEWMGVRRELANALRKVDEEMAKKGDGSNVGTEMKLVVVQTGIFASALRVVEFWDPKFEAEKREGEIIHPSDPRTATSESVTNTSGKQTDPSLTHGLSSRAHKSSLHLHSQSSQGHGLEPLLSGPLALLTLPTVSPRHLRAALSILAPTKEFPAPRRRENPGYHEASVQNGVHKLLLLGARVEGRVFDFEGARWVGGIEGGLEGLRGQIVAMLQGVGVGITGALEAASRSLYVTVEGRRGMLEEEEAREKDSGSS